MKLVPDRVIKVNTLDRSVQQLVIGRPMPDTPGHYGIEDDEYVSTRHALLMLVEPGRLRVEDLGSTNGTLVNGQKVLLSMTVGVGSHKLRVGRTDIELVVY